MKLIALLGLALVSTVAYDIFAVRWYKNHKNSTDFCRNIGKTIYEPVPETFKTAMSFCGNDQCWVGGTYFAPDQVILDNAGDPLERG